MARIKTFCLLCSDFLSSLSSNDGSAHSGTLSPHEFTQSRVAAAIWFPCTLFPCIQNFIPISELQIFLVQVINMIMHHVYYITVLWIGCNGKVKSFWVLKPIGSDHARLDNMNCNYTSNSSRRKKNITHLRMPHQTLLIFASWLIPTVLRFKTPWYDDGLVNLICQLAMVSLFCIWSISDQWLRYLELRIDILILGRGVRKADEWTPTRILWELLN